MGSDCSVTSKKNHCASNVLPLSGTSHPPIATIPFSAMASVLKTALVFDCRGVRQSMTNFSWAKTLARK
eukprot:4409194-Karenia_brevis.AAC.1